MATDPDLDDLGATPDEKIVNEAKRRFKRCVDWEAYTRRLFLDDMKFANGDADNFWQWPNSVRQNRDVDERPCVTVNRVRQHNLNIINDAKQNKPSISIKPTGDGATLKAAQTFESVVRYIERKSKANTHYDQASMFQVTAGYAVLGVVSDYADDDSFDQELFIEGKRDPLCVYFDPDAKQIDRADGMFAFEFDDMPKDVFARKFPKFKDKANHTPLGRGDDWITEDHVRVCGYWRIVEDADKLIQMKDPSTGEIRVQRSSDLPAELVKMLLADETTRTRDIKRRTVEWYLVIGDEIAEKKVGKDAWPGKRIPLVPVIGEEVIIAGVYDRKGHTRAMKDPQRIYNYWSSSVIEFAALQTKIRFMAPAQAIEGYETYWSDANKVNFAILPYNHIDGDGRELKPPIPIPAPVMPDAYMKGMMVASEELRMVTGQYQSDMGEPGNETSGRAIQQRQRQGDTATYHFIDNLAIAIRSIGEILVDVIPKFYDTPRVMRIVAKDGTESDIKLDPQAAEAHAVEQANDEADAAVIFNPNVGKYAVESDIGPAYATQRQEAFNAFTQILTQAPDLVHLIGDLMFMAADFPMAEQVAERLKRMVPPQALGQESPQMKAAAGEIANLQAMINHLAQQLSDAHTKAESQESKDQIEAYNAVTKRLDVMMAQMVNPRDMAQMLHDLMRDEHQTQLGARAATQGHEQALEQSAVGHGQSLEAADIAHQQGLEQQMAAPVAPEPVA